MPSSTFIKNLCIIVPLFASIYLLFYTEKIGINKIKLETISGYTISCSSVIRGGSICKFSYFYNGNTISGYSNNCSYYNTKNATLYRGTALLSRKLRYYLICDD